MKVKSLFSGHSGNKRRRKILKITACIVLLFLLIMLTALIFIRVWAEKKIESVLKESNLNCHIDIKSVHILFLLSGIELRGISVTTKDAEAGKPGIDLHISSIKIKDLKLVKALLKKEIYISEVTVFKCTLAGKLKISKNSGFSLVSPFNITIGRLLLDSTDVALKDSSSKELFSLKDGILTVTDLKVSKNDSITPALLKEIDFKAKELFVVRPDSMYTYRVKGVTCSSAFGTIGADTISIHPNYGNYEFTSRYKLQKDRIEVLISGFSASGFDVAGCLASGNIVSSYFELGKMEIFVFRDKRKEFNSKNKPSFQELIRSYPAILHIDSIAVKSGGIVYTEHQKKANEPGSLRFEKINAKLFMVANDLVQVSNKADFKLQAHALFMKEGKVSISLTGKLNDPGNSFTVNGSLKDLDAVTLNPFLEKTAFMYATAGHINYMNFTFSADNSISRGNLTLAYKGLNIALKNKQTDDTTALKEKFLSLIVNMKINHSNPMPGEAMRVGIIEYKRDPQRFLFGYCAKSIMSGIRSSIVSASKKK
jgi:hypothetical protein